MLIKIVLVVKLLEVFLFYRVVLLYQEYFKFR